MIKYKDYLNFRLSMKPVKRLRLAQMFKSMGPINKYGSEE